MISTSELEILQKLSMRCLFMMKPLPVKETDDLEQVDETLGEKELWLTIENTPEDRLNILQKMKKLKYTLEKSDSSKATG